MAALGVGVGLSRDWIPQGDFLEEVAPKKLCICILRDLGGLITDTGPGWGPGRLICYSLAEFLFLIKCVYLAIDGNLQTQALVNIISDLLLASYVAAPGVSPSMEEETGAERGVVPLPGSQSWEVEALGFDPRRLTTTADPGNALGCSHLEGGESAGWVVWPAQGRRAVRHRAGPRVGCRLWPHVRRSPAGRPREGGGLTVPTERSCRLAPGMFITPGVSSLPGLHSVLKCSDVRRAFFIRAMKLFSACCQAVVKRRGK